MDQTVNDKTTNDLDTTSSIADKRDIDALDSLHTIEIEESKKEPNDKSDEEGKLIYEKINDNEEDKEPKNEVQQSKTTKTVDVDPPQQNDTTSTSHFSDEQNIDAECEKLLRKAKRQVKQMMEEAVTKKFIHEESSSIISLCVAIDACLSHGLKRRALGLFKTNSSTALIHKVAKNFPIAQEVLTLVEDEEKSKSAQRQQQQQQRKKSVSHNDHQQQMDQTHIDVKQASNLSVCKQNMWIKCALIEKKLVEIVEYLASNANKYYEPDALMANYLSAQLLCSLLVGPCALEFSRSKTNDYYQFEEPSADELLKRHKLSNPIACLCSNLSPSLAMNHHNHSVNIINHAQTATNNSKSLSLGAGKSDVTDSSSAVISGQNHAKTDSLESSTSIGARSRRATVGQASQLGVLRKTDDNQAQQQTLNRHNFGSQRRRRPLALKTNVKTGALVTDCHHYSCQEITEHQQTRGYSFKYDHTISPTPVVSENQQQQQQQQQIGAQDHQHQGGNCNNNNSNHQQHQAYWSVWSPRMLHETLHQNSKSKLLYAKNNVLMETQPHETMAGYLSLHQTNTDLTLKWIPNQMINGQAAGGSLSSLPSEQQSRAADDSCTTNGNGATNTKVNKIKCSSLSSADDSSSKLGDDGQILKRHQPKSTTNQQAGQRNDSTASYNNYETNNLQSVESSYLDLVVSLSVSRIVLLHCQFGASLNMQQLLQQQQQQHQDDQTNNATSAIKFSQLGETTKDQDQQHQDQLQQATDAGNDDSVLACNESGSDEITPRNLGKDNNEKLAAIQDRLILVEVDGVQRAPFIFPKGGLRWFLSCLEGGLRPHKFLEPAIRPNDGPLDPLAFGCSVSTPSSLSSSSAAHYTTKSETNSPSMASEPGSMSTTSKLDLILSRLPSLKRRNNYKSTSNDDTHSINNEQTSRTTSPTPSEQLQQHQLPTARAPLNYVYRIISTSQPTDFWRLQTPPNSAPSIESTFSGSFGLINGPSNKLIQSTVSDQDQHFGQPQNDSDNRKFRWSLSRLTRFSSRYTANNNASTPPPPPLTTTTSTNSASSLTNINMQSAPSRDSCTGSSALESGSFTEVSNDHLHMNAVQELNDQVPDTNDDDEKKLSIERDNSREFVRVEAKLSDLKKSFSGELMALRNQSIQTLCESMRRQILARAFYGWLAYCRRTKIIRTHLTKLINADCNFLGYYEDYSTFVAGQQHHDDTQFGSTIIEEAKFGLTRSKWEQIMSECVTEMDDKKYNIDAHCKGSNKKRAENININDKRKEIESKLARVVNFLVYYGGIESNELRMEVWPFLLGHFNYCDDIKTRKAKTKSTREAYEACGREWIQIERVVKQRDSEILAANMARVAARQLKEGQTVNTDDNKSQMVAEDNIDENRESLPPEPESQAHVKPSSDNNHDDNLQTLSGSDLCATSISTIQSELSARDDDDDVNDNKEPLSTGIELENVNDRTQETSCCLTESNGKRDSKVIEQQQQTSTRNAEQTTNNIVDNELKNDQQQVIRTDSTQAANSNKSQPQQQQARQSKRGNRPRKRRVRLESTGSVGSDASITDQFGNNIHRIDKDVQRCDRNFWYFKELKNLDKLRNVMYSYVWQHLDVGYVQGMCDLAAPFLVIFDDEILAYTCFERLMTRMVANFPHGCTMDQHFESLKYLMQVLDPKLFEVLQNNGDYTHFYFCYRWLLLDFKRELAYEDVFRVWETIWSARCIATDHFVVFMALAMVRYYRDIIIENNMDFTDTIKFFNEMAERHDAKKILALARDSVVELESLIRA